MEFKTTVTRNVLENTPLAIHKLIASISCRQLSAWHGATAGVCLPENCNQSVQSHSLSVTFMHLNCKLFISSSLQQSSSLWFFFFFSFFLLAASDPASHCYSVCQVSVGETVLEHQPSQGLCLQGLWWLHSALLPSLPAVQIITHGRAHRCVTLVTLCCLGKEMHECLGLSPSSKIKLCVSFAFFCPLTSLSWDPSWNTASRSQCRKDVELLDWVQRMGTKMTVGAGASLPWSQA